MRGSTPGLPSVCQLLLLMHFALFHTVQDKTQNASRECSNTLYADTERPEGKLTINPKEQSGQHFS